MRTRGVCSEFVTDRYSVGARVAQIVDRGPEACVAVELLLVIVLVGEIAALQRDLQSRIGQSQCDAAVEQTIRWNRAKLICRVPDGLSSGGQLRSRCFPGIH